MRLVQLVVQGEILRQEVGFYFILDILVVGEVDVSEAMEGGGQGVLGC